MRDYTGNKTSLVLHYFHDVRDIIAESRKKD